MSAEYEYTICTMANPAQAVYNVPVIVVLFKAAYTPLCRHMQNKGKFL